MARNQAFDLEAKMARTVRKHVSPERIVSAVIPQDYATIFAAYRLLGIDENTFNKVIAAFPARQRRFYRLLWDCISLSATHHVRINTFRLQENNDTGDPSLYVPANYENDLRVALNQHVDYERLATAPLAMLRTHIPYIKKLRDFNKQPPSQVVAGDIGFADQSHLLQYTQDANLPADFMELHRARMNLLFKTVLTSPQMFQAIKRIYAPSLPVDEKQIEKDIGLVHAKVARIWGIIKPSLSFNTAVELNNHLGDAGHETEELEGKKRHVFKNRVAVDTPEGKCAPRNILAAALHEVAHSIEDFLIVQLCGKLENVIFAQQRKLKTPSVVWKLQSVAAQFALNCSRWGFGIYTHPKTNKTLYRNQLRERHARWFAEQLNSLFIACISTYELTHRCLVAGSNDMHPLKKVVLEFLRDPRAAIVKGDAGAHYSDIFEISIPWQQLVAQLESAPEYGEDAKIALTTTLKQLQRGTSSAKRRILATASPFRMDVESTNMLRAAQVIDGFAVQSLRLLDIHQEVAKTGLPWPGFTPMEVVESSARKAPQAMPKVASA